MKQPKVLRQELNQHTAPHRCKEIILNKRKTGNKVDEKNRFALKQSEWSIVISAD